MNRENGQKKFFPEIQFTFADPLWDPPSFLSNG